jgi:hypothetical protein
MTPGLLILLSGSSIDENSAMGSVIGGLSVTGPELFTFSLLDDASGRFSIDASNQLVVNGPLDYEEAAFLTIVVQADDLLSGILEETFLIRIENVDGVTVRLSGSDARFYGTQRRTASPARPTATRSSGGGETTSFEAERATISWLEVGDRTISAATAAPMSLCSFPR